MFLAIVGFLIFAFGFITLYNWLEDYPAGWFLLFLFFVALFIFLASRLRRLQNDRAHALVKVADSLEWLVRDFKPVDTFVSLREGETAFYEREMVELREHKSSGSSVSSGFGGVSLGVTQNIGVVVGGGNGQIRRNPETQTTIDSGRAIFTNQRIIFAGSSHTREFEFTKIVNLEVGVSGFEVAISTSGRERVSTLAGDSVYGITPGIIAQVCYVYFKEGKAAAQAEAKTVIDEIRRQNTEYQNRPKWKFWS